MRPSVVEPARRLWARVRVWHLVSALGAAFLLSGLGGYTLTDPDDGRYGEIAREMLERGDWVTPTLNYTPYFEKPPLLYWLTAVSLRVFGQTEWAVRIVPATCAVVGLLVAFWLADHTLGRETARWVPAILASSPFYFALARVSTTDVLFSLFLASSLTAWYVSRRRDNARAAMVAVSGGLLGLAVLAKGPVALVLFAGVVLTYALWTRQPIGAFGTVAAACVVACIVAAPWFILVQLRNPQFSHYFFVVQHFQRFTGLGYREHEHPFWYFLPIVLLGFWHWVGFWPGGLRQGIRDWRQRAAADREPAAFLIAWAVLIFLFFSASRCKLVTYVLPCWWPVAIGTAGAVRAALQPAQLAAGTRIAVAATAASAASFIVFEWWYIRDQQIAPVQVLLAPGIVLSAGWALGVLGYLAVHRLSNPASRLALLGVCAIVCWGSSLPLYRAYLPYFDVGATIPRALRPPDPSAGWTIAQYGSYNQSLAFYTRSRVVLIDAVGELRLGLQQPDASTWFRTGEETIRELAADGPLALVASNKRGTAERIAARFGLTVWARTRDRALLLNGEGLQLVRAAESRGAAP